MKTALRPLFLSKSWVFGLATVFAALGPFTTLAGTLTERPVPNVTIYPGQSIKADTIVLREFPANFLAVRGALVENREEIVGKIARRTLLPGVPIPAIAIGEPKLVLNGAKVRIIYDEEGISITTYGSALQAGSVGERVAVRNADSGAIITGTIDSDGSVRVGGS
jgi:flagella basal body P-ring formation protein FlgA